MRVLIKQRSGTNNDVLFLTIWFLSASVVKGNEISLVHGCWVPLHSKLLGKYLLELEIVLRKQLSAASRFLFLL